MDTTANPSPSFNESHKSLIKRIYWIVLGLGFSFIVRDLLVASHSLIESVTQLVYFIGLYYFLAYDWVAYSVLIETKSYQISADSPLFPQLRFYTDMTHLLIKAALIFLALRPFSTDTAVLAAGLFAGWHISIAVWHWLAEHEPESHDQPWKSHKRMILVYAVLAVVFLATASYRADAVGTLVRVALLMVVVMGYSTWRKWKIITGTSG